MYGIESLLAGRTLAGRYRIDAVIGRGGMGAVYRASDQRLGREVAIKVITVVAADDDSHQRLRARFLREARAAGGLHHTNVVQVFDYGTDPDLGLDFLVMELLRGEDLATRLNRKGPPAVATALDILYQAARGLAAGHRAGLIHRDVKPGNLYLEPGDRIGELQVKVLDFGIADITGGDDKTVTHLTVVGRSPFSPAYASPEQLRGEDRLSPATDVFSLGAVGFHMFTGQRAFSTTEAATMVVELGRSVAAELPRVQGLTPESRAILLRALAPDPRDRYPDAAAFAAALEPLANHAPLYDRSLTEHDRPPAPVAAAPARATVPAGPDETRLYTRYQSVERPTASRDRTFASQAPLSSLSQVTPPVEDLLTMATPLTRPEGWMRRTARKVWRVGVTAVAVALFAGAWFLVTAGLSDGNLDAAYAGAATSILATPWAIHRLMRRPGSFRFSLFCCIAGSVAVALLLRREDMSMVLAALFATQLSFALIAERLTRPRLLNPFA